ncbi:hypothetical protein [Paraburkholderia sp. C35]|uniref:hypothetical protein n=1 Tax=Paraburkholderia sp. C35 TaxID=2126993 RepID=UPI0013A59DA1|nr:hypothetical protein [Paraburkholderia sp. C35]
MADPRKLTPLAETTGIRLRAGLLSSFSVDHGTQRCAAQAAVTAQANPLYIQRRLVAARSSGFPYPFFLDSVRCHA